MQVECFTIPQSMRSSSLLSALLLLWENSVKESHDFLSASDINDLRPYVLEGLKHIDTLVVASVNDVQVAFLGVQSDKIEMLFVAPEYFRHGIGKRLVETVFNDYHVRFVDVNEQNPDAKAFYEAMGFYVFERSDTDDQGNDFPILHMKL